MLFAKQYTSSGNKHLFALNSIILVKIINIRPNLLSKYFTR